MIDHTAIVITITMGGGEMVQIGQGSFEKRSMKRYRSILR